MSYIQSVIRCDHCKLEMNVAFGVVGMSIIAQWPEKCPKCGLGQFTKIANHWEYTPVEQPTTNKSVAADPPQETP